MRQPSSELSRSDSAPAVSVIRAQAGIAVVAALAAYGLRGEPAALAAAYGGLTALLPTAYVALRIFVRTEREPHAVLAAFYRAELGKWILAAAMFLVGAKLFPTQFLPLLLTFAACQATFWLAMMNPGQH